MACNAPLPPKFNVGSGGPRVSTFRRCEKNDHFCKYAAVGDCQLVNIELGGQGEPRGRSSQMVIFSHGPDSFFGANA